MIDGVRVRRVLPWREMPEGTRIERGLLNGEMVRLAYQSRGMARHELARRVGLPSATIRKREVGWHFWTQREYAALQGATDYPPHFFTADEAPLSSSPTFACGYDEETGTTRCHVREWEED